jgi:hypothetical protein
VAYGSLRRRGICPFLRSSPAPRCAAGAPTAPPRSPGGGAGGSLPQSAAKCQAGVFFSIVQKKVTGSGDFPSLEALSQTLLAFVERHNRTARPFGWHYTAADLKDLLRRITEHEKQDAARQNELALAA